MDSLLVEEPGSVSCSEEEVLKAIQATGKPEDNTDEKYTMNDGEQQPQQYLSIDEEYDADHQPQLLSDQWNNSLVQKPVANIDLNDCVCDITNKHITCKPHNLHLFNPKIFI